MISSKAMRTTLVAGLMVLSSMAGCISTDDASSDDANTDDTPIISDNNTTPIEPVIFGTVMVSTYHVGELAKAVGGDNVLVEYMSLENIPVHDYDPSLTDLVRLQNSDLFLYHGLNLEPWVESTLSAMENAPPSYMTHTMPDGEATVDYDSFLLANLCELMIEGPFEPVTLGIAPEDQHDDHEDHEDHDDHDDHEDHDGHSHAEAEKEFVNPESCPADTTIQVFHMEAGEHVLEFESEHNEDFNMAVLKMLGGHAHHHGDDHGDHDDHDDDHSDGMCHNTTTHENYESTEEECANAGHMWTEGEDHDHDLPEIHADRVVHTLSFPEHMVCYDVNAHTVNHTHDSEAECDAANMTWTAADSGASDDDHHDDHSDEEGDHDDHSDEDEHHEAGALVIHIEEEGDYGFALPTDIEMFIVMGEDGHDGHDGHDDHGDHDGDDHGDHDDDMVCYDMSTHTVDSSITAEEDCEAAGLMWTAANSGPGGDDDHDEAHDEDGQGEIGAGEDEEAFDYDPHSWLDPLSFNAQLNLVKEKMTLTFPEGADIFASNAAAYSVDLIQLHSTFQDAFGDQGSCEVAGLDTSIIANHNAYSYLSVRYGVDIMTVHGLDPEGEPSPAEVAEVVEHIQEEGITVLYVEEFTDQTAVQSIVEETGVQIKTLYTMEMRPTDSDDDYISMMNKNVQNMVAGIGC